MSDDYVRKDTFDEILRRMEAMSAANEARMSEQIAEIRGDVKVMKERAARFEDVIYTISQDFNKRVDDITRKPGFAERLITWGFAVVGFAIGLAAVIVAGAQVYLAVKGA